MTEIIFVNIVIIVGVSGRGSKNFINYLDIFNH